MQRAASGVGAYTLPPLACVENAAVANFEVVLRSSNLFNEIIPSNVPGLRSPILLEQKPHCFKVKAKNRLAQIR